MKGIVIAIITFALAFVLIIGVIIPIMSKGKSTGQEALTYQRTIDSNISNMAVPIN